MDKIRNDKINRTLAIYTKLIQGKPVNKTEEAKAYGVNKRSIQRDIEDIREFLESDAGNTGDFNSVIYDRRCKGFRLEKNPETELSNEEILAICKILLDSRAFTKGRLQGILKKVINGCVSDTDRKSVLELIGNEAFHYIEPRHKTECLGTMWELGQAIQGCRYIEIKYKRTKDKDVVTRRLKPLSIMFSEYYFYLAAFIDDEELRENFDVINDSYPTIYRIDRIKELTVLDEKFRIPYRDRFEEGEFRKRVQFMYGGRLQKVRFKYVGPDIDAVLDRLPTAEIVSENDGEYVVSAEVFGKGIEMWMRSQGEYICEIR